MTFSPSQSARRIAGPGPWQVKNVGAGLGVIDADGRPVATLGPPESVSPGTIALIQSAPLLLEACKAQKEAIDRLFALLIDRTRADKPHCFYPSESGQPWDAMRRGVTAIAAAEHIL